MKKYAIIVATLLLGVGCQTRHEETSSTMPMRDNSYGTPGMGVQSGTSSSMPPDHSAGAIDSPANHRDALQDNSSAVKDQSDKAQSQIGNNLDVGTPGQNLDQGAATDRSDRSDVDNNVPQTNSERLDQKDNSPLIQPDQTDQDKNLDLNTDEPIHQKDSDATLRPVEPLTPE